MTTILAAFGCGEDIATVTTSDSGTVALQGQRVAVVTSDYAVYSLAVIDLTTGIVTDEIIPLPLAATIATLSDGRLYNVNQLGTDTIRVYSPDVWSVPELEWSVGDGSANPHGVTLCASELYVAIYGGTTIDVYDPNTGIFSGFVDLSAFDDGDGLPEIDSLVCTNGMLYATVQQLDRNNGWVTNGGAIVEIDTLDKVVIQSWMVGNSPRIHKTNHDSQKIVLVTGAYYEPDGFVGLFDPVLGQVTDTIMTEADYNVDITAFAISDDRFGIALGSDLADAGDTQKIFCVDIQAGTITEAASENVYYSGIIGDGKGGAVILARTHWAYPDSVGGAQWWDIEACTLLDNFSFSLDPYSISFF